MDVSLEAMLADDGSARGQSVCSSVSLSPASDVGASSRPLSAVPLSDYLFTAGFPPSLHSIPCSMYSCLRLCSLSHTLCIDNCVCCICIPRPSCLLSFLVLVLIPCAHAHAQTLIACAWCICVCLSVAHHRLRRSLSIHVSVAHRRLRRRHDTHVFA